MLILSREADEQITIEHPDGNILITIVETGSRVRLGFKAPRSVVILRTEIIKERHTNEA